MHVKRQMQLATIFSFLSSIALTWRLATQYHWTFLQLIPIPTVLPCMMAFAVYKEHRPTLIFLLILKALAFVVITIYTCTNMIITYVFSHILRILLIDVTPKHWDDLWVIADVVVTVISWKFSVTLDFYYYIRERERASRKSVEKNPNGKCAAVVVPDPEPNNNCVNHYHASGQRITRSKRTRATT